mgnify:CR=1 FL=1
MGRSLDQPPPKQNEFIPVPPGSYNSAAIIMLTDGQRTTGVDPLEAAKWAADRGVRVYTVGVGTVQGEVIGFEGWDAGGKGGAIKRLTSHLDPKIGRAHV